MSVCVKNWSTEYFIANQEKCRVLLENADTVKEIPSLNAASLDNFRDKQLVRFRGMVQDMYNPEYYLQEYEVRNLETGRRDVRSGMYIDAAHCWPNEEIFMDSELNKNSERQTCFVISTPGLNEWAKETAVNVLDKTDTQDSPHCSKRGLEENEDEQKESAEPAQKKGKALSGESNEQTSDKSVAGKEQNILSKEYILNFPVPMNDGKACIVKIYDEAISLKLNQVIDIIGFISLDPMLSVQDSEEMDAETNTHNPPTSLVPRLHAIKIDVAAKHDIPDTLPIISKAQLIRGDLQIILSQLLFGDELAAEYLICHLLSSVYLRKDCFCFGSFPLNITNFPIQKYKTFPKDFYDFLSLLVKKSHFLEVTLENLNDLTFIPKKDYDCNRLNSGVFQLSDNTHLVIDETVLNTGQLSAHGRQNYNSICDLVNFQKIKYDFKYYTIDYETDIPIIILSEAKSFIPCQTLVVLKTDSESEDLHPQVIEAAKQYLKDENRLANIRQYLEVLRHTDFEISESVSEIIQQDFVQLRQCDRKMGIDNLHGLMVFARFMCLSHGATTLTVDYWKKALQMELERIDRLPQQR